MPIRIHSFWWKDLKLLMDPCLQKWKQSESKSFSKYWCWWVKTISGHNGCGSGGQGAQTGQGDEDTEGLQGANIYTNWYKMVPFLVYITFTFYIIWYLRYFHFLYFWHFPFLYHSKSSFKITYNYKIYKIYRKSQAKLTARTSLQWAPVSSIYFEPGYHHHHGYPAYSHHDKIPPCWEYVSNDKGGNASVTKSHHTW